MNGRPVIVSHPLAARLIAGSLSRGSAPAPMLKPLSDDCRAALDLLRKVESVPALHLADARTLSAFRTLANRGLCRRTVRQERGVQVETFFASLSEPERSQAAFDLLSLEASCAIVAAARAMDILRKERPGNRHWGKADAQCGQWFGGCDGTVYDGFCAGAEPEYPLSLGDQRAVDHLIELALCALTGIPEIHDGRAVHFFAMHEMSNEAVVSALAVAGIAAPEGFDWTAWEPVTE